MTPALRLRALPLLVLCLLCPTLVTAQIVTGSGPGSNATVRVIDVDGTDRSFLAYPVGFGGGTTVALGDINGDGVRDIITGAGPSGGPHVRVWNGVDLTEIGGFFAYSPFFAGGVSVAAGDVNGDGRVDIITGAGPGGGPHVRVWSGVDFTEIGGFFAYDAAFPGGVSVAAGDVDGDGRADIITGAGPGGGPHVRVWSGADFHEIGGFFAYSPFFAGGVHVAAGDVNGDGLADIITGAGPGGGPHVRLWNGATFAEFGGFFAYDPSFPGGVKVAALDLTYDGRVEILTVPGPGAGPLVAIWTSDDFSLMGAYFAFDPAFTGGMSIASPPGSSAVRFTSATATTFSATTPGTFTVTTVGGGAVPTLTVTGALPTGVTFTDNGDRTATLAGTPAAATGGSYPLTFTATSGSAAPVTQSFTLTISQAPAITSAAATTFGLGGPGTFTVTTTGFPTPTLSSTGALPAGVTFTPNADGTATLAGTPAPGSGGAYPLMITATNGVSPDATQAFVLTVNSSPAFTSANATAFTVGAAGTFAITTIATPPVTSITRTGAALPTGVTYVDNGNGTATLSGTPAAGTGGVYVLTLTAANGVGTNAVQTFTLTVNEAPAFTSAAATTFTVGSAGTFTVTTTGEPDVTTITLGGAALPAGVTFVNNGNGTATLSGTPGASSGGTYALTFTANNGVGGNVVQNFTLTVNQAPAFTSANATTFSIGAAGTFTVTTSGVPAITSIVRTGAALPTGVTYVDNGNGTATLSGTPAVGTGGVYNLIFTINNGVGGNITQNFALTITEGPVFTSAASTTFIVGTPGTFTITTTAEPDVTTITIGGAALPAGVTFVNNGNGTATLSGTPAASTGGTYALTFTANNGIGGNVVQNFTLTVNEAPTFTSANSTTFTVGVAGSFTVTTAGIPGVTAIARTGAALPSGLTYLDNGDGTATLSGTPLAGSGGAHALIFTINNGVGGDVVQNFTLNVNQPPLITSAGSTSFTVGSAGSFNVTMTGFPAPTVSVTAGTLPSGVTLSAAGLLSGTPAPGTGGVHNVTLTASNGIGANAVQAFTLTVNEAPAITSANTATFVLNVAGTTFQVVMTGFPAPTVSVTTGVLPTGLTLSAAGLLSGTPTQSGSFPVTLTATNGTLPNATQAFTIAVNAPPAITSAASDTFIVGTADTFTVTTTGFPAPTVSQTGTLPTGVTFTPATRVLGGTPTQTGTFNTIVFTATNGINPDAVQNFTLTVACPAITVTALSLPDGLYLTAYGAVDFNQSGSTGSGFTWGATGLPAGITIDTSTGVVSGTPTNTQVATGVTITVTDNFGCQGTRNTTLTVRPSTDNENYIGGVGHTQYVVSGAVPTTPHVFVADNVKVGDNGPGALSVVFGPATNGTISEGPTDGTFTYTPNVNFAGPTDSFGYTLTDGNGVTNTATVTITLSGLVWYVNNSGGNGDGRSHAPFNTLANATAPSGAGSVIYVHTGAGTTPGNLTMDASQTVFGAGGSFAANNLLIPAGTKPTLSGTVTAASGVVVRHVNFSGAAPAITATATTGLSVIDVDISGGTVGILLNAVSGTIDFDDVDFNVSGPGTTALSMTNVNGALDIDSNSSFASGSAAELLVSGGTGAITITAPFVNSSGQSINIQARTGATPSTVIFAAPITDTGTGIVLDNNDTTTFIFRGGVSLSTGANAAFTATNGGTVNVCALDGCASGAPLVNTIATTTGTALNVSNTNIGASGLTFRSISANGAPNGIVLNTTGSGALTVTGNSAGNCGGSITVNAVGTPATVGAPVTGDCTGGTIQATTGAGISLTNTTGTSLTRMHVLNSGSDGLLISNVNGFTLARSFVTDNSGVAGDRGIEMGDFSTGTPVNGTITISNSTLGPTPHDNFGVGIASGTSTWTITSTVFTGSVMNSGFNYEIRNATMTSFTIDGSVFQNQFADGMQMQPASGVTATVSSATIQNSTFQSNNIGMDLNHDGTSNVTYRVLNNTFMNQAANSINFFSSASPGTGGTLNGRFVGNVIGNAAVFNSGGGIGIRININGGADSTILVDSNAIRQVPNGRGIEIVSRNGTGGTDATVTNNQVNTDFVPTVANGGFSLSNIFLQSNCVTVCNTLRADVRLNTVPAVPPTGELIAAQLALIETGASTLQLVDSGAASASCTAQLTENNTGNAAANAGCTLIPGPIDIPPL